MAKRRGRKREKNVYAPPEEAELVEARPVAKPRERPAALTVAIIVATLFMGPCSALGQIVRSVVSRDALATGVGDHLPGLLLNIAILTALWGMWQLKRKAVFGYAALTLLNLLVGGMTVGMTPFVMVMVVIFRAPPLVAAYFYSDRFS